MAPEQFLATKRLLNILLKIMRQNVSELNEVLYPQSRHHHQGSSHPAAGIYPVDANNPRQQDYPAQLMKPAYTRATREQLQQGLEHLQHCLGTTKEARQRHPELHTLQ